MGDLANLDEKFKFTLKLEKPIEHETVQLPGSGFKLIKSGTANQEAFILPNNNNEFTFSLSKDDTVTLRNLPAGWTYSLTTENASYTTKFFLDGEEKAANRALDFKLNENGNTITCQSERNSTPPTGLEHMKEGPWLILVAIPLLLILLVFLFRRRKTRNNCY